MKTGEYEETDIPAEAKEQFDHYYNELIESISATDDTLLERYLEGGDISREEAIAGMKEAMKRMELFPLFCVSGELNYGTQAVLSTIVELMPNAYEMEELHAFKGAEGDATVEIHADDDGAVRRARLQDDVRAARRRRDVLPPLLGHDQQRRRAVQRHAKRRREAQPPVDRPGTRAHGDRRSSTPATSAASPSCATRTRTTRCRRARTRCVCR